MASVVDHAPERRRPTGDRWLLWPSAVTCFTLACALFFCGIPGVQSLWLPLLLLLACPIAAISLLVWFGLAAVRREPRRASSILFALAMPTLLWEPIIWGADYPHLALTAWFGAGQIGSSARPVGNEFSVSDWSTGLASGPNTFLIHDVTDEIKLPLPRHTQPVESQRGFGDLCAGKVRRLLGHYYVCNY